MPFAAENEDNGVECPSPAAIGQVNILQGSWEGLGICQYKRGVSGILLRFVGIWISIVGCLGISKQCP